MKKKIILGRKLKLNKDKLNQLTAHHLQHFMGGRMAAATSYTSGGDGTCSISETACCSNITSCHCTNY